ncbi:STAS domain-containing protein [Actinoplanes sp. M2I2]|uniref:STAS domain-containing protein n=1 Tax=Actinoplanes sp. M2I2 TaxID=1734444 RepID=UPI00202123AA|nr:STAS domain-containing protein [Actinoplanes sp. M2I2]
MTVLFAVGAEVTRADIPCLCSGLADLLRARPDRQQVDRAGHQPPSSEVVCDVSAARPDVVTVEALARLRLTAGRHGWRLTVRGARPELIDLFSLMGLGGFFAAAQQAATRQATATPQTTAPQASAAPPPPT